MSHDQHLRKFLETRRYKDARAMAELDALEAEVERLQRIEEAARAIYDGMPFLHGKPGEDFGGDWVPFVEALAVGGDPE